jgi:large subunit ribosomal protein L21|tara:strand:- start:183 stop:494 length:312 start_codon:yes stop_codon:yes gene_type:complete
MYAIIADGGRQYKVEEGQELDIDLRNAASGDEITFDQILAVSSDDGTKIGQPVVEGATVTAEVLSEVKGEKIYVQKFRRRKDSKRRTGHRQRYTRIRIAKISG